MNYINIVFITDNNYVMPTGVAITSIMANKKKETCITFYVICDGVSEENKRRLCYSKDEHKNIEFIFIDVNSNEFKGLEKSYSSVSRAALLKFRIPDYISNVDKVLYLDGDIIVTKDLSEFYHIDLGDNFAAVISDGPKDKIPGGKKHLFYGNSNYFNSGVMLLNLHKMRNENSSKALIEYRIHKYNYFMDQDAFNQIFSDKVIHTHPKYDFMLYLISYQNKRYSVEQLQKFYKVSGYRNIDDMIKDTYIFHYTFAKPWKYFDIPMNELWMSNFEISAFSDQKLERKSYMTELYESRTYQFSRKLSKIALLFIGLINKKF